MPIRTFSHELPDTQGWSPVRRTVQAFGAGILRILYPSTCLGCHAEPLPEVPLCARCLRDLERPDPAVVTAQLQRLSVAPCLATPFALWLFDKGGTLQRLQHQLKYGNRPQYGFVLGRYLGQCYQREVPSSSHVDQILPIPLHRTRWLERGYNQSTTLAAGVAEILGCPVNDHVLIRPHATRSQTTLNRTDRWQNVRSAFALAENASLRGQRLLLIDDVFTTGATLSAAALTLLEAGAAEIRTATLALADT